jgi:hypothetical protein
MVVGNADRDGDLNAKSKVSIWGNGSKRIPRDQARVREDQVLDALVKTESVSSLIRSSRPRFLRRVVEKYLREGLRQGIIGRTADTIREQIEKYRQHLQVSEVESILELALNSLPNKSRFERTAMAERVLN